MTMPIQSITVGPGTFTIGDTTDLTTFESQVTECRLSPSVENGDPIHVLSGETESGDRSETWVLKGTMLQDFGSTGSRTEWLFEHRGESHPFTYVPATAKGKKITGTLTVEAIEIGGEVKTKPTSEFEFSLVGAPTIEAVEGV